MARNTATVSAKRSSPLRSVYIPLEALLCTFGNNYAADGDKKTLSLMNDGDRRDFLVNSHSASRTRPVSFSVKLEAMTRNTEFLDDCWALRG